MHDLGWSLNPNVLRQHRQPKKTVPLFSDRTWRSNGSGEHTQTRPVWDWYIYRETARGGGKRVSFWGSPSYGSPRQVVSGIGELR